MENSNYQVMKIADPLTPEEISLIKATREKLVDKQNQFRKSFYGKIFDLDPSTEELFREGFLSIETLPDSFEFMHKHADNLVNAIPEIKKLGLKHKTYRVKPKHYPIGKEALVWTLQKYLGDDYSDELGNAWQKIFTFMSEFLVLGARRK
ncbi:MAG: globin domain-containing protein [Candidatus Kariarchaeaceae archaeon]|jgi:nitric oxide dioxygenase